MHDERGVIADQFYAERLYTANGSPSSLEQTGFRNVRHHGNAEALSDRDQDLGMMARRHPPDGRRRRAHERASPRAGAGARGRRLMGDPRLPDTVKRGGSSTPRTSRRSARLKDALSELPGYQFRYLDNHATLERDLAELRTDLVFNLCDEGFNNDAFMELHVPAHAGDAGHSLHRRRSRRRLRPATTRRWCAPSPCTLEIPGAARDLRAHRAIKSRRCLPCSRRS